MVTRVVFLKNFIYHLDKCKEIVQHKKNKWEQENKATRMNIKVQWNEMDGCNCVLGALQVSLSNLELSINQLGQKPK